MQTYIHKRTNKQIMFKSINQLVGLSGNSLIQSVNCCGHQKKS